MNSIEVTRLLQEKQNKKMEPIRLETIDLELHFSKCIEFRTDSYFVSFGNLDGLAKEFGDAGNAYRARMREKIERLTQGKIHMWLGGQIVGQLEMRFKPDEQIAYVNLFYVTQDYRGRGLGARLEAHANHIANQLSIIEMQLNVSPSNVNAIGFYEKSGWRIQRPRSDNPSMVLMSKDIERKRLDCRQIQRA